MLSAPVPRERLQNAGQTPPTRSPSPPLPARPRLLGTQHAGQRQAERLGRFLAERSFDFDALVSSPKVRALETAAGVSVWSRSFRG